MDNIYMPKTELEKILLHYYDDIKWDWYILCTNELITIEFVLHHLHFPWRWAIISQFKYIPEYVFRKYPFIIDKINWNNFTLNSSFKLKYLYNNPDRKWNWYVLSSDKNIDLSFILQNSNKSWLFDRIYERKDLDFNKYIKDNPHFLWDYKKLSHNTSISLDTINKFKDKLWDWNILTNIYKNSLENISKYADLNWNWYMISESDNITVDYIKKHIYKNWNWYMLSEKKIFDLEFILEYPGKDYNWNFLDIKFDIETIKKCKDMPINWCRVSSSQYLRMEDIEKYIHFPWCWKGISENPNLTLDFMKKYESELFNFKSIVNNKYNNHLYTQFSVENMDNAKLNLNKFKEELIRVTWSPDRIMEWCFSIDDLE